MPENAGLACWSCLRVLLAGPAAWFACWSCSCTVSSTPAAPKIEPLPAANPHASGMDNKLQNCASKLLNVSSETGISIKARKCWSFLLVLLAVSAAWFACWSCSRTVSSTAAAPKIEPPPAANPHASKGRGSSKIAPKNCLT